MQFWIEKKKNSQEQESAESVSLLDLVKLDIRKKATIREIPVLEVAYVSDGLSVQWETKQIFNELLDSLEFKKVCDFSLADLCPRKTRIELMQQVCGLNCAAMSPEAKIRPPQPKKKQKRVTFIEQPTIVTCDGMDELAAAHRREVETMQMLSTSQVSHGQKQTIVQKQATTYGDEATIIGVEASQAKSGAPICLQEGNTSAKPAALPTMSKVQTTDHIGTTVCMEQEQMHTVKQSGAHLLATNQPGVASQCKPEATKLQNQLRVSPQQAAPNPQQEQMHTVKQPVRDLLATKQPNVATQVKLKASNLQK